MTKTKSSHSLKRMLVLVMIVAMLASLALPAMAASGETLFDETLDVTHGSSEGCVWNPVDESTKTEWSVTAKASNNGRRQAQPMLKFENVGEETKTIAFDLTAVFDLAGQTNTNRQAKVVITYPDKTTEELTASFENKTVQVEMAQGETLQIQAFSYTGNTVSSLNVSLTNLKWFVDTSTTATFEAPVHGSYTVNGSAVTASTELSATSAEGFAVAAAADAGYRFCGWMVQDADGVRCYSRNADDVLRLEKDAVVKAAFAPETADADALFGVETGLESIPFADFDAAVAWAKDFGLQVVTLLKDYTLTGTLTVPDGITLLVPFNDEHTCYTDTPELTSYATPWVLPVAYRTLTLASGASLVIENGGGFSDGLDDCPD